MNDKVKNCFTLKCSKNRPNSCKWYDKELAKLLHKKDRLYKQYITTGSPNLKAKYQKLRNLYTLTQSITRKKNILNKNLQSSKTISKKVGNALTT